MQATKRERGAARAIAGLAVAGAILAGTADDAFAQLDPLLFMKTLKPNVLLVVDTANRMQRDAEGDYYDQNIYTKTGALYEGTLGVAPANTLQKYRRRYVDLAHLDTSLQSDKFATNTITIVGDRQIVPGTSLTSCAANVTFSTFDACTRMAVARAALARAVTLNSNVARFGLIKMRQLNAALGAPGNEGPVKDADPNQISPTDTGSLSKWKITRPTVTAPNGWVTTVTAALCAPNAGTCGSGSDKAAPNDYIRTVLGRTPDQGGLIPAGQDSAVALDAPVKFMLDDARQAVNDLLIADSTYRNTVVVLVVGGGEGTTSGGADPASAALAFKAISGHRVPIYVIAIAPPASAVAQLQSIAANSGGQYCEITKDMINAVAPGAPVPELVRAVNAAVQHTFAAQTDFNAAPTGALPFGPSTEFQVTSPIIGTVNLTNSVDIAGTALPNSVITMANGNVIPQRSNVLVTTAVAVPGTVTTPGFPGRLRAFRVYRPEPDSTKTSGYKFVGDGTALWVARAPTAGEGSRNIYTVLPDGSMLSFTSANAAALAPYLCDRDAAGAVTSARAADLIDYIRAQPLGAFIDGTPAFLDAPSLDPPPDAAYPAFVDANKDRRTLIFIGANDGMLHAIDARTGVEVWAFIPANLLPKLRALREGQAVEQFRFFVDGSPKIADVKVGGGWHTYMVFGEGPGGTYYQTMDVTMTSLGAAVPPDSGDVGGLLTYFSDPSRITFKWSFPSYQHFNYAATPASDYPNTPYGDLDKTQATAIEKTVGQTWSDPAVGQVKNSSGTWVTLVGSGFLAYSRQHQPNRADAPAGTTFYVLDMATGAVLDSRNVGNDGVAELIDNCSLSADVTKNVSGDCTKQKNALQADPVATGPPNSRFIDTVYMGDLDGKLWRFSLGLNGLGAATVTSGPVKLYDAGNSQPLYSSMAVVNVGGTQQYVFFGTGSDLLPSTGVSQSYKLVGVLDQNGSGLEKFSLNLAPVNGADNSGERVSAYPAVAGDIVFFTTTTYKPATSGQPPDANVYALTFIGGPAYDNTGDNAVTNKDTPKVKTLLNAGRATAPFVSDQHLVMGAGGKLDFFGDPQDFNNGVGQMGVRILSWREIR